MARFEPAKRSGDEETGDEESERDDSGSDEDDGISGAKEQANAGPVSNEKHDTFTSMDIKPDPHTSKGSPSQGQAYVDTCEMPKSTASTSGVVDSAAALLADSAYTSAPKRRRRL